MSSSRDRVEDTYESQNDQRLDELHSKIRTLRGITTDIHDDVERQNLMLDDTVSPWNPVFSRYLSSQALRVTVSAHLELLWHKHHEGRVKLSASVKALAV
ncbi:hypothetical protein R3P38DRAFT_1635521 [Favolaschia claudopus]|uniref:t-SNARE coiled-coil homology domain-containing protein n=1 Tax=Favolaschia claudopus TaxID=2862362 RepID=A0AAW0DGZ2_9AGAR